MLVLDVTVVTVALPKIQHDLPSPTLARRGQQQLRADGRRVLARATERHRTEGDSQMSVRMARAKIKADKVADVEKAAKEVFTEIEAVQPQGVHYASCKLPDGVTFVILLGLDNDENNPLVAVPAFRDFQENLQTWIAEPPVVEQLTTLGSYRLF
jgi:hypothetical protein